MKLSSQMVFLCLVLLSTNSFSQDSKTDYLGLKKLQLENSSSNDLVFFCRKRNTEDAVKSQEAWKPSILLTTTGDTLSVMARLLSQKDEIEILLGNDPCLLFQEKTEAIAIDNQVFLQSEYPDKDQLFLSYFELISEGKIALLKKGDHYFYKKEEQPAKKIKRSKKGLCQISKTHHKEIEKYMRLKGLNPKNDNDLAEIFHFINKTPKLAQNKT